MQKASGAAKPAANCRSRQDPQAQPDTTLGRRRLTSTSNGTILVVACFHRHRHHHHSLFILIMVTIIINIMIILIIPKIKVEVVVGVVLTATSEAITPRAMHSCCELWQPDTPLRISLLLCLVAELKASGREHGGQHGSHQAHIGLWLDLNRRQQAQLVFPGMLSTRRRYLRIRSPSRMRT